MERLGGIPLALNHAGSFLRQTGCTVSDYLDSYNKQWDELFGHDKTSATYKSIESAWTLSFGYVKQKDESAAKLLLLWAHLDNTNVSYQLLASSKKQTMYEYLIPDWFRACVKDNLAFLNTIKILIDYSLIEATVGARSYAMHPLLHDWCYHFRAKKQDEFALLATLTLGSAQDALCSDLVKGATISGKLLLPHCDRLSRHIDDRLADRLNDYAKVQAYCCSLLSCAAYYANHLQHEQAERFSVYAHNAVKKLPDSYNELKFGFARALFRAYMWSGKPRQAEEMILQNLEGKRLTESYDPEVLGTFCDLARLYMKQKRWRKAEGLLKQILEVSAKDSSKLYRARWEAFHRLGHLYQLTDNLPEAEVAYSRALEEKMEYGADSGVIMRTVRYLGDVHFGMNNLTLAEQMYKSVLNWQATRLGADDLPTTIAAEQLACTYKAMGRYGEAETLFLRAKNWYTEWLGPSHERTLDAARGLQKINAIRSESARASPRSHAIQQMPCSGGSSGSSQELGKVFSVDDGVLGANTGRDRA